MPTGKKLQSWRKLMPSQSPRFPPITEIIVHTERPVSTVSEISSLHIGTTISRIDSGAKCILIHETQNKIWRILRSWDTVFKPKWGKISNQKICYVTVSIVIADLECTKVVKHGERHVLLEIESPIAAEKAIIILS